MKYRHSYGILLFRLLNDEAEVLLVEKKYTYAFCQFVMGNYSKEERIYINPNIYDVQFIELITKLLEKCTIDELLMIRSLNFDVMWNRVSLKVEESRNKAKSIFIATFIATDNGEKLHTIVQNIIPLGNLLWEIPKGKKIASNEKDMDCAKREFYEETGIVSDMYNIITPVIREVDNQGVVKITYSCMYFAAVPKEELRLGYYVNRPMKEIIEYGDVSGRCQWFSLNEIKSNKKNIFRDMLLIDDIWTKNSEAIIKAYHLNNRI